MDRAARPNIYTIPAHRAFADSLVAGIIAQHGRKGTAADALARGIMLLPSGRAVRAVRDAFVRASGSGLLLPRLAAIGDLELAETVGVALDAGPVAMDLPPAIAPMDRLMILARLVQTTRAREGKPVDAGEAMRLAMALATTLDQLLVERKTARDVMALGHEIGDELQTHWQASLESFALLLDQWPRELAARGMIDAADRRNRLFDALARHWRERPPASFVVAAGITTAAPAVARLLRAVADLERGAVVLPDLDQNLTPEQWDAIVPVRPDPLSPRRAALAETHPQFALKLLLDRMDVHRDEVAAWRWGSEHDARAERGRAITLAMLPAPLTGIWQDIGDRARVLRDVTAIEAANPAEEAQAIAIAMREALETPERTAALVTPDRDLAARVSAHLRRWGIEADDSAGRPLSQLAPGTLLMGIAAAAAERFAPVPLLALLKHPLVRAGQARLAWLDKVRALDLLLRGPRPAPGLAGIDALIAAPDRYKADLAGEVRDWWGEARGLLAPIEPLFQREAPLADLVAGLRETASLLSGDAVWAGHQGRAAAALLATVEEAAPYGPPTSDGPGFVAMLGQLLAAEPVRPPQGGHPRLSIWGLLEARLQQADLMILGGLNEGTWPALPAPDPWLAPRVRQALNLPGLDRRIGLAAHDFANGLGSPRVLITRAARDVSAPTVASRFWLRLKALAGPKWDSDDRLLALARAIDAPAERIAVAAPRPSPSADLRPRTIAVTDLDRLKADPYAFYARKILRLSPLDPVDADPSAAWRGTAVHDVLDRWFREDAADPDRLHDRARAMLDQFAAHPVMRAMWRPRLMASLDWIAATVAAQGEEGRIIALTEAEGKAVIDGITLRGKADRIDRMPDGSIVIIDYKTGQPPSASQVAAGYSLQLGLIGLIARAGGFDDLGPGVRASGFEYWSLGRSKEGFGYIKSPCHPEGKYGRMVTDVFVDVVARKFGEAAAAWLTGTAPFVARPHPDAPVFSDYDQLMRLDEWYGRGSRADD